MNREVIINIGKANTGNVSLLAKHALKLHDEVVILKLQIKNLQRVIAKDLIQTKMLLDPCVKCGENPKHLKLSFCADCYTSGNF